MSLLNGARELATRSHQRSTPLHIFQAALPQPPYLQASYPQASYLDEPTKSIWENLVPLRTREEWAHETQQRLAQVPRVSQQGMEGMESPEFTAIETEARSRANQTSRHLDAVVLALVIERDSTVQDIIRVSRQDYRSLIQSLDSQPAGNPQRGPTMPPAQTPEDRDRDLANRALNDFLTVVEPTSDRRYKTLDMVEVRTLLTTLAESASNRATVVCVGQDGSLISLVEDILADRLNSGIPFTGRHAPLNSHTGDLYKVEVESLVSLVGRVNAPRPATMLKVVKENLAARPERPILLLDHIETIQGESKEMQDLRIEIAERDQVLVCGIFHAPDEDLDKRHLQEARLGRDNMKPLPFRPYSAKQTVDLLSEYFVKQVWRNQGRYTFAKGAFDDVIKLQPGAWHDQKRKVLPGLVIDLTQDAMDTASRGEAVLHDTVTCALEWFKDLRDKELPSTTPSYRRQFEQLLKKCEEEVGRLLDPPSRQGGFFGRPPSPPVSRFDPNKPIEITSAHIVAELVCHNVSEFHYPDPQFDPAAVRRK